MNQTEAKAEIAIISRDKINELLISQRQDAHDRIEDAKTLTREFTTGIARMYGTQQLSQQVERFKAALAAL